MIRKVKRIILYAIIMISSLKVFAKEEFFQITDVSFDKEDKNKVIYTGASLGWQSIYITTTEDNEELKYISICKHSDGRIYVLKKDGNGYRWKKGEEELNFIDDIDLTDSDSNKIAIGVYALSEVSIQETQKEVNPETEKYITDCAYIPFLSDIPENSNGSRTFISLAIKKTDKNELKYVICAAIDDDRLKEEESINTINALSLKALYNKTSCFGNPERFSSNLREYLNRLYEAQYPVYGQYYTENAIGNSFNNYRTIDKEEGKKIAAAAKRYLNWAVEYVLDDKIYGVEILSEVNKDWGNKNNTNKEINYWTEKKEFPQGENGEGNPIPYVTGGLDTPRTFWKKMQLSEKIQIDKKNTESKNNKIIRYKSFQPGTGSDSFKYAGTDSLGFFTGVIAMSGLDDRIKGINGDKPAENLNEYSKNVMEVVTKPKNNSFYVKNQEEVLKELLKEKNYRFVWEDLQFITMVVPDMDKVAEGDFLVNYDEGNSYIAVVADAVKNNEEKILEIIYMDIQKGTANKKSITSLDGYTARRLLVHDEGMSQKKKTDDILDTEIDDSKVYLSIEKIYEQGQTDCSEKWRYIPNTGEYLMLDATVKFLNKSSVNLLLLNGYSFEAEIVARDRDYEKTGTDEQSGGNIYRNKAVQFEIGMHSENNTTTEPVIRYKIKRKTAEEEKKFYAAENDNITRFTIGNTGKLINNENNKNQELLIGIRPVSSDQAYPGDDLILGLKIYSGGTNESQTIWAKGKDYIAVYDKKMMWRANLYITEKDENKEKTDWNDIHPWNVAPDGSFGPVWWNGGDGKTAAARWGTNEWNRKLDFNSEANAVIYSSFQSLPSGDGTQVVEYQSRTPWYYGMQSDIKATALETFVNSYDSSHEQEIKDAVAYDYMGWDNPFSYNKKMKEQMLLIEQLKPATQINHYTDMIFPMTYGQLQPTLNIPGDYYYLATEPFKPKFFDTYAYYPDPASVITRSNPVNSTVYSGITLHPYLPGLSDSLSYRKSVSEPYHPSTKQNKISMITAGVDCNGLLQMSMAYSGSFYSALKQFTGSRREPVFWDSSESEVPVSVMNYFHNLEKINSNGTVNKNSNAENQTAVIIGTFKQDKTITYFELIDGSQVLKTKELYTYFKYLVPGDVVWYRGHIMIVSSIKEPDGYDENNEPYWNDSSSVLILESVFHNGDTAFGVVKKRSLQWLSNENRWGIWRQK